jgi:hypothetical protein
LPDTGSTVPLKKTLRTMDDIEEQKIEVLGVYRVPWMRQNLSRHCGDSIDPVTPT